MYTTSKPIELAADVLIQVAAGDYVHFLERRFVFEVGVGLICRDAAEFEGCNAALADDFQFAVGNRLFEFEPTVEAGALQVAVETTAKAAVCREHKQRDVANCLSLFEQRVVHFETAREQILHQLRHAIRERRGGRRPIHGFLKARGRDQLHRPRDFADVADRLASFI